MAPVSYQTIKLSKGKHMSPDEGACVMELASMLAGESFTDHPASACPVIGSFLRAYNDSVDEERRQDLYTYASRVVGTRCSLRVQRLRAERLAAWATEIQQYRWTRFFVPAPLRAIGRRGRPALDAVGSHAVRAIHKHTPETHAAVLSLIDELLLVGTPEQLPAPEELPAQAAQLQRTSA